MAEERKPAAGYIRMSTDQQQDSPARQRADVTALAERSGYAVVVWYEDHGLTGTESAKRAGFQRLLEDAKASKFRAVLLSEQSRMSREDIFDCMQHWKRLRDAGVSIVTCQRGELKFDNLGGVITAIVDQYGAREESIRLADRVVSGKRLAIRNGQRQAGALLGYDREIRDETGRVMQRVPCGQRFIKPHCWSSRLVVSENEQMVAAARFVFESIAQGMSYCSIAKEMNRRGWRTMYGNRFNSNRFRRMVTNRAYIGELVAGRFGPRGKFRTLHGEGIVCPNSHEPLIDRELFERVQKVVAGRYREPRAAVPGRYLLAGLVHSDGGLKLQGKRSTTGRYYAPPGSYFEENPDTAEGVMFRAEIIEQGVLAKLREFLADERNKRSIRAELTRRTRKAETNAAGLERKLADVRAKIERGTENLALAAREDVPGVSRLLGQWRDEEARLKDRLRTARGEGAPSPEALEIMSRLDDLLEQLSEADREKLAFAVRQTVKRVTLRRSHLGGGGRCGVVWDGVIELRDDLGTTATIALTDEDIPSPGLWRDVVRIVRERGRGGPVYMEVIARALGCHRTNLTRPMKIAILAGKIRKVGHRMGYVPVG
jgi:DNA invertase Pin-like site-specific DNA recombinase